MRHTFTGAWGRSDSTSKCSFLVIHSTVHVSALVLSKERKTHGFHYRDFRVSPSFYGWSVAFALVTGIPRVLEVIVFISIG